MLGDTSGTSENFELQPGVISRLEDPSEMPFLTDSGTDVYSGTDVSLFQLALHEIGHALGLSDDSDPSSVMYATLGAPNQTLDATDIAMAQAWYGPQPQTAYSNIQPTIVPHSSAFQLLAA